MKVIVRLLHKYFEKLVRLCAVYRAWVIGVSLLLTLFFGFMVTRLVVNNTNDAYFVEGDPALKVYRQFHATFGSENFLLIYMDGKQLFTPKGEKAVADLIAKMNALQYGGRPLFTQIMSPFTAPILIAKNHQIAVRPVLENTASPTALEVSKARQTMMQHPLYADLIVNRAGTVGAVVGTLQPQSDEVYMLYAAHQMIDLVAQPQYQILGPSLIGEPVIKLNLDQTTARETSIFCTGSILVTLLALLLMFRRFAQVFSTLYVLLLAVIWTIGFISVLNIQLTLVTVMMPLIIIITGIGSCVQIISTQQRFLHQGLSPKEAIIKAVINKATPCLFTSLTTAIGLLSMLTAAVTPMRQMGLFSAIGVLLCYLLTIVLLPAFLSKEKKVDAQDGAAVFKSLLKDRFFATIGDVTLKRPWVTIGVAVCVAVFLASGIFKIKVESNFINALKKSHPARVAIEKVDTNLGGSGSLEVILDSGSEGGIYDPQFLSVMENLSTWLMTHRSQEVTNVLSPVLFLRELNRAFTGSATLPATREGAAQLMLLYEVSGGNTRAFMGPNAQKARLSVHTRSMSTTQALALEDDIRKELAALNPHPVSASWVDITGGTQLMVHLSEYVTKSQLDSFLISGIIIACLMIWLLGSLWLGFASMVPNILPIFATYGIMGWLGWPLDWLSALIPGVALGVAVDATIHIAVFFQRSLQRGMDTTQAAHRVIVRIGKSLTISNLALSAGFGVIAFSSLATLARLGILLALCLFMALLTNLLMTPAILSIVGRKRS